MKKMKLSYCLILVACACIGASTTAQAQSPVFSINGDLNPTDPNGAWNAHTYGIDYTMSCTYTVNRIEANWNGIYADGRTITIYVYDENPNQGGKVLATGSFSQNTAGWQGADLDVSVDMPEGEDFFIGFSNNTGVMGQFFSRNRDGEEFTVWYGIQANTWGNEDQPGTYHVPIWRFFGSEAPGCGLQEDVPVPAGNAVTWLVLLMLLGVLAIPALRRARMSH